VVIRDLPASTHASMLVALALGLALVVVVARSRARPDAPSTSVVAPADERRLTASDEAPRSGGDARASPPDISSSSQTLVQETAMSTVDLQSRSDHLMSGGRRVTVAGANIYSTYATARNIAALFGFFGWLLVGVGGLIALVGLSAPAPFPMIAIALGVGVAALGMLQVAAQQILRATVDSADYARQSLLLQVGLAEGRADIDLRRA